MCLSLYKKKVHYVWWPHSETPSTQICRDLIWTFCVYIYIYIYIYVIPLSYNGCLEHWNITSTQVHMQQDRFVLSSFKSSYYQA